MANYKAVHNVAYLLGAFMIFTGCNSLDRASSESQSHISQKNQDAENLYGVIQGSVHLEDGTPMENISIRLYTIQDMKDEGLESVSFEEGSAKKPSISDETVTDSNGHYTFENVKSGEHLLISSTEDSKGGAEIVQVLVLPNQTSTVEFKAVKKKTQRYEMGRFVEKEELVLVAQESLALQ